VRVTSRGIIVEREPAQGGTSGSVPSLSAPGIENGKITKSGEKKKRLRQKWGLTPIFSGHLSLAFRFPRHTVTATVINLIVT
jgi:hypothetical protein